MASTGPDPIHIHPTPPGGNNTIRQPGRSWGLVARIAAPALLLTAVVWLLMREQGA